MREIALKEFQSTPAIADGRTSVLRYKRRFITGFNPRPPSLTGERRCTRRARWPACCFNPRPPSLTGEPERLRAAAVCWVCFNPRPPSLTGELQIGWSKRTQDWFQSTPAIADGRT